MLSLVARGMLKLVTQRQKVSWYWIWKFTCMSRVGITLVELAIVIPQGSIITSQSIHALLTLPERTDTTVPIPSTAIKA